VNLPNILTVVRLLLTVIFIYFLNQDGFESVLWAAGLFTVASITDFLDGYIARKYNLITPFGKIMDPIADKFLTLSAFFIFMQNHLIAGWMFVLICAREVIVTILRLSAMRKGIALAAESAGKVKTVLQIFSIYFIMIVMMFILWPGRGESGEHAIQMMTYIISVLMLLVLFVTLWSGTAFIINNRKKLFHAG